MRKLLVAFARHGYHFSCIFRPKDFIFKISYLCMNLYWNSKQSCSMYQNVFTIVNISQLETSWVAETSQTLLTKQQKYLLLTSGSRICFCSFLISLLSNRHGRHLILFQQQLKIFVNFAFVQGLQMQCAHPFSERQLQSCLKNSIDFWGEFLHYTGIEQTSCVFLTDTLFLLALTDCDKIISLI